MTTGSPILIGEQNTSEATIATSLVQQVGGNADAAVLDVRAQGLSGIGVSADGVVNGVNGTSTSGTGVNGTSTSGTGVTGTSASGTGVTGSSTTGAGVHGLASSSFGVRGDSDDNIGVWGSSTNGVGVRADSTNSNALVAVSTGDVAITATSPTTGINATGTTTGISAAGTTTGISATANGNGGTGVEGECDGGTGVVGRGNEGVRGEGIFGTGAIGVEGVSDNIGVLGGPREGRLFASGPPIAVGVLANAPGDVKHGDIPAAYGGWFDALNGTAPLHLEPSPDDAPPPTGLRGDFFVDNGGRLWFCIEPDTASANAIWKQVQLV